MAPEPNDCNHTMVDRSIKITLCKSSFYLLAGCNNALFYIFLWVFSKFGDVLSKTGDIQTRESEKAKWKFLSSFSVYSQIPQLPCLSSTLFIHDPHKLEITNHVNP